MRLRALGGKYFPNLLNTEFYTFSLCPSCNCFLFGVGGEGDSVLHMKGG